MCKTEAWIKAWTEKAKREKPTFAMIFLIEVSAETVKNASNFEFPEGR